MDTNRHRDRHGLDLPLKSSLSSPQIFPGAYPPLHTAHWDSFLFISSSYLCGRQRWRHWGRGPSAASLPECSHQPEPGQEPGTSPAAPVQAARRRHIHLTSDLSRTGDSPELHCSLPGLPGWVPHIALGRQHALGEGGTTCDVIGSGRASWFETRLPPRRLPAERTQSCLSPSPAHQARGPAPGAWAA